MSFADHIRACNNFDRARVVPLIAGEQRIGWLRHDNAAALAPFGDVFVVADDRVRLAAQGASRLTMSFVLDEKDVSRAVRKLHRAVFEKQDAAVA